MSYSEKFLDLSVLWISIYTVRLFGKLVKQELQEERVKPVFKGNVAFLRRRRQKRFHLLRSENRYIKADHFGQEANPGEGASLGKFAVKTGLALVSSMRFSHAY